MYSACLPHCCCSVLAVKMNRVDDDDDDGLDTNSHIHIHIHNWARDAIKLASEARQGVGE